MTRGNGGTSPYSSKTLAESESAFRYFEDNYAETMQRMFAAVSQLYDEHWHEYFHFAIFDEPSLDWDEAFRRTHERYFDAVGLDEARHVVELACGRGALTKEIAKRCQGDVLGIDISGAQLSAARAYEGGNLQFLQHDIMKLDELDERFDAAIYTDAACYLPDKALAAERIASILEPGARLLLVDWCKAGGLTSLQEELVLHPFMRGWAIPHLETADGWQRNLERAGFKVHEVDDLNDRVRPNWEIAYERAIHAVQELTLADLPRLLWTRLKLGAEGAVLVKAQLEAALYIKAGFDAGFLRYVLLVAERR